MSIADGGGKQLSVHGPKHTRDFLSSTKLFFYREELDLVIREFNEFSTGAAAVFKDDCITVQPVILNDASSPTSVSYICTLQDTPGRFDAKKAAEIGIPVGPERKELLKGRPITLASGRVVAPEEVVQRAIPGQVFFVVHCDSLAQVPKLLSSSLFSKYQTTYTHTDARRVAAVFHVSPYDVQSHAPYIDWMHSFGDSTHHVAVTAPLVAQPIVFRCSFANQCRLNAIHPLIFPVPHFADAALHDHPAGSRCTVTPGEPCLRVMLRAGCAPAIDRSEVPLPLNAASLVHRLASDAVLQHSIDDMHEQIRRYQAAVAPSHPGEQHTASAAGTVGDDSNSSPSAAASGGDRDEDAPGSNASRKRKQRAHDDVPQAPRARPNDDPDNTSEMAAAGQVDDRAATAHDAAREGAGTALACNGNLCTDGSAPPATAPQDNVAIPSPPPLESYGAPAQSSTAVAVGVSLVAPTGSTSERMDQGAQVEPPEGATVAKATEELVDGFGERVPEFLLGAQAKDMQLVFLGTGSAIPSRYRAVSAIYLSFGEGGSCLLDCGEGTYGQLVRRFGPQRIDQVLTSLQFVWISHLHADHHVGLPRILSKRTNALQRAGCASAPALVVIAPAAVLAWLDLYRTVSHLAFRPLYNLDARSSHPLILELQRRLGEFEMTNVAVDHCSDAYGLVLTHKDGWKFVYSGDTRPCTALVTAGEAATLLVHEATFEDSMEQDANAKAHSTIGGALSIAHRMRTYRVILTHFSQRYPHVPPIDPLLMRHVCLAFDFMTIPFHLLPIVPALLRPITCLFDVDDRQTTPDDLDVLSAPLF